MAPKRPRPMSHEELGVALLRDEYVDGHLTLDGFEDRVERLLAGDLGVVPMGGMPPPKPSDSARSARPMTSYIPDPTAEGEED